MNAVEMRGIVKQYPLVRAIDGADFTVEQGEIHSLLGENGAGKSTLMKILYGMTTPTAGEVRVFGKPVAITRPAQAIALGIGMVHQHFMLTPVMTVAENVVIGSEPVRGVFFDRKKAEAQVAAMIDEYNFHISATAKVETLSVGEQQRVEILKALYRGADLLILDDLGTEFNSSFFLTNLYSLLNNRLGAKLPTIVTTNITDGALLEKLYTEKISSRLAAFVQIQFLGSDIRVQKAAE